MKEKMPPAPVPACMWSLPRAGLEPSDEHVEGMTWRSLMITSHANGILGQGCRDLHAQGPQGRSIMGLGSSVSEQKESLGLGRVGSNAWTGPWGYQAAIHTWESSESMKRKSRSSLLGGLWGDHAGASDLGLLDSLIALASPSLSKSEQ